MCPGDLKDFNSVPRNTDENEGLVLVGDEPKASVTAHRIQERRIPVHIAQLGREAYVTDAQIHASRYHYAVRP